ncbi:MAG: hypothetical protein JWR24_208 [Actinoallomurus sp.]|nr:hypothetical protein [Actinoallomurus sp.]
MVVPGIAAALILTGCKDGQGAAKPQPSDQTSQPAQSTTPGTPGTQPPTSQPSGQPTTEATTRLTITVRMSPTAKPITRTLTCDPVGGDVPRPADACAALAKAAAAKGDPFAPTPKGQMCTQIYGGPEVATVTGTYNGKKVNATFNRKNGCELKRWGDLAPLFGPLPPVR